MSTATLYPMPHTATAPVQTTDEDRLWEAIVERKRELDGTIFYGVMTTGIYCRTVCPAKRPKRENVRFFGSQEAAERAGLRACLRCHPKGKQPADAAMSLVRRVVDHIEQNLESTVTLETIGAALNESPFTVQRTFKTKFGISPMEYANARRMSVFKTAIRMGKSVVDATYDAGFGSSRALYERAESHLGMSPARYRKGGVGLSIGYTVAKCSLGQVLVASTGKGICKIGLGDDQRAMLEELRMEFPGATISAAQTVQDVQHVIDLVEAKVKRCGLPLDLHGTAFQLRVWKELQNIPFGQTATYAEIAERIGMPQASRAVARACASNRVAIAVPCHRVVRKSGMLSGYRWGVQRKQQILAREAAAKR
jgi:AraC family transcriptional regulator, regulatory protein of adaptative response / methylated-DNA-[protein]-cysteine methyltransferase